MTSNTVQVAMPTKRRRGAECMRSRGRPAGVKTTVRAVGQATLRVNVRATFAICSKRENGLRGVMVAEVAAVTELPGL